MRPASLLIDTLQHTHGVAICTLVKLKLAPKRYGTKKSPKIIVFVSSECTRIDLSGCENLNFPGGA